MKMNLKKTAIGVSVAVTTVLSVCSSPAEVLEISSLEELAEYAGESGNNVKMGPGTYKMTDFIPLDEIPEKRKNKDWLFLEFSGDENVFNLTDVTIEFDTRLRKKLHAPIHTPEFVLSGNNNTLKGLTIRNLANHAGTAENVLSIRGEGNVVKDVTLYVKGSTYGYGDLLGKGGPSVSRMLKHSGMRIRGANTRVIGCEIYMHSFGHGFYIQSNGDGAYFEDCYVEGEMRSTDDMLKETAGPAYENDFASVYKNREGEKKITPGYKKSLAEDGFRSYGCTDLTFVNCTSKNMRGAFEMRAGGVYLENCSSIGNERGFWIGPDSTVKNCRGDARYGPLVYVEGKGDERGSTEIDVEVMPAESEMKVHALAAITGNSHKITISPWKGKKRDAPLPIKLGYAPPKHGANMTPMRQHPDEWTNSGRPHNLTLINKTTMPVIIGEQVLDSTLQTRGEVLRNEGEETEVKVIEE